MILSGYLPKNKIKKLLNRNEIDLLLHEVLFGRHFVASLPNTEVILLFQ